MDIHEDWGEGVREDYLDDHPELNISLYPDPYKMMEMEEAEWKRREEERRSHTFVGRVRKFFGFKP